MLDKLYKTTGCKTIILFSYSEFLTQLFNQNPSIRTGLAIQLDNEN